MSLLPIMDVARSDSDSDSERCFKRRRSGNVPVPSYVPVPRPLEQRRLAIAVIGHSILDDVRQVAVQRQFSESLAVPGARVHWLVRRGLNWRRFWAEILPVIPSLMPDIIYFHLAENDLDSPASLPAIMGAILRQAEVLTRSLGVDVFIVSMALHRTSVRTLGLGPLGMRDRVDYFNQQMRRSLLIDPTRTSFCQGPADNFRSSRVWWWEHNRLRACPPSTIAPDGVHLTPAGNNRLLHSLKRAVQQAAAAIRN